MELTNLIDGMLDAPIENLIAIAIIIVAIVFWAAIRTFSKEQFYMFRSYIFNNRQNKKLKTLRYHDMFRTINDVRTETSKATFYTDGELDVTKGRMFADFMDFKLNAVSLAFLDVIERAGAARNDDHLKNMIQDAVMDSVKAYILRTENHFLRKGIPIEDAKYAVSVFEEWRVETIKSVTNEIKNIFSSEFHVGKYEKLLAVLQVISMAISLIPKDGKAAFNSMNGKFKKIKYKQ
tara:strand:- start:621 stop:1325 length:705 start_codon:yes stop_codon:yes gene_type:complete